MSDAWLILTAAVLVAVSGVLSAADAAMARFSPARAEELLDDKRVGARYLVAYTVDRPRYLNSALLLRVLCEVGAATVVALEVEKAVGGNFWATLGVSVVIMGVVSFVVIGVGPRTLGRQHNERIALLAAAPITWLTRVLGPIPNLLILLGNALTPGKGFRQGPFNTETELREMVDLAEASNVIEDEERQMIHNVFELGDTTVRQVMVPRGDVVFIERYKNLRQTLSLFLRSGFSRIPVVDDSLDVIVGMAYFKDVVRRDFEAPEVETVQRIEEIMRPVLWVPESKPVDDLLTEMQKHRQHIAVVVDEYGGTAGLVTIEDIVEEIVGEITDEHDHEDREPRQLLDGSWRVPARFLVDDLEELGFEFEEDEVESVGGLLAKYLSLVPIPGSSVEVQGLRFTAEETAGRRNKIGTVLITPASTGPETRTNADGN